MKLFKRMVSLTLMSAILVGFSAGINADAGLRIESVEKLDYIVFPQNAEVTKICCSNLPRVCSVDISTTVKLSSLQCVYFENMDVGSYRLSGEMFMLMCRRTEYSANGQYIKLR